MFTELNKNMIKEVKYKDNVEPNREYQYRDRNYFKKKFKKLF